MSTIYLDIRHSGIDLIFTFRAVKWHNKVPVTCFKQWTEHRFQSQGKLQLPINSTHFFHASSANFYQALWAVLFWNHTLCWPSGFCQQCCFLCNKVNSAIESSIENANFQRHWCIASNISMEIVYWLFVSFRFCFYPQTGTSVSGLGPVSSRFVLAIRSNVRSQMNVIFISPKSTLWNFLYFY